MKTNLRRKPAYSQKRANVTLKFLRKHMPETDIVLDIGEPNPTSKFLQKELDIRVDNTISDLDYDIDPKDNSPYKVAWCFEVIEHLMNPRTFLDNLNKVTTPDGVVFLSYPSRPKFLWNNKDHFHEYDSLRRTLLFRQTNWKIEEVKPIYLFHKKIGIRPIIRNFIPVTHIYKLTKRNNNG